MAISVGSVSVRVVPDAQRFTRDLESQIGNTARDLGKKLGADLSKDIDKPIVDKVRESMSKVAEEQGRSVGSKIGKTIGDGIADGMGDGAKRGGKQVESQGKDSGGAFAREFSKAVTKAMSSLPSKQTVALGLDDKTAAGVEGLRRRLASLSNKTVGINIDGDEAIAELKLIEAEANKLARESPTVRVNVKTDLDTAANDLARFRARAGAEGDQAGQNFGGAFERKIRDSLSRAASSLPDIKVDGDTSGVDRAIANVRTKIESLRDAELNIDGDPSGFLAAFAEVRSDLAEINGSTATANIRADAGEALRQMGEVEAFLNKIDGQRATANVNVDDNGSSYVVDTNVSRLLNRLMLFGSAATGIAALVGPLLAVGAAAGVAAAALGVGILAFGGIGDAVKALNDQQDKSGEDAAKAAKKQVQSANQIASAQDRLGAAQRNVGTVQQNVADAAISAATRVRDADEKVQDARQKAARSATQAAQNVRAADEQVVVSQEKATQAAIQAAENVRAAEQRLASTRRDSAERALADEQAVQRARQAASDAAVQAARRIQQADVAVHRAEESLADAQKAATIAQKALTTARKDATRQLLDMQDAVTDNALSQRGAALDLIEARQELDKTNSSPGTSALDRAKAQLAYDQALQQTKELSRAGKELGQDYATASAAGVEGSEQVTQAQDQIVTANRGVRDSQTALTDAQRDANDARVQGSRDVEKANQDLANAQRQQASDAISSNEQINDAVRAVGKAQADQAQSAIDNARSVRSAELAAQKARDDQAQTAIDNSRSIRDAEQSAADARREQDKQARQGQEQIAQANQQVVDAQRQLQNAYSSAGDAGSEAANKVANAFKDLTPIQADFARFIFGLKDEFLGLRAAAADAFLPGVKAGIESLLTRYGDFKQVLGQFGSAGGQAVKQIADQMASPYFTQFWHTMGDLSGPILGGLADTVGRVAKATGDWVLALLPLSGIGLDALNSTADFFSRFAESLPGIARPLTFAFQDMLGDLGPLGPALEAAAEAFASIGRILATLVGGALVALTPLLNAAAGALRLVASILGAIPQPLIAVLTALLALRVAKTIFGDFARAIAFTRKAYPAFGKDTRLAANETAGLGHALSGAGAEGERAGKSFRKGGTDAAASQRQHLLLRTAVRDVGGMFDFARTAADKARDAYARGGKDAERVQKSFDSFGRGVTKSFDGTAKAASGAREGLSTFARGADAAAVATGESFRKMATSVGSSLSNVRSDAARGVSLGKADTKAATPSTTLDMGDYTGAESMVTRLARSFTRLTTASDGFASSARRGFSNVRASVADFGAAVGAGFDRLRLGASQGEGALARVKQAFSEGGVGGAATEARRTFTAATDGMVASARTFVADGVRAFTGSREGILSVGAAAQQSQRTFTASKNGIVTDIRETGGELVKLSDHSGSLGTTLGRQFANLSDKVFPGFRQSATALGREAQAAFLNTSAAINEVRNRAAASSSETQSVLGRMGESFRNTRDVFVAGADGISRGFQSAGEKGLLPFQADADRVFSAVSRGVETAGRFVAGAQGITRETSSASSALVRMGQSTSTAVTPLQTAGDKAEAMGRILGTVGQTIQVSAQRIGKSLTDVGTDADAGTTRAGRAFTAFKDGIREMSTSTAVALYQTGALVRSGIAVPSEEAANRVAAAGGRIRSDFNLTEARALTASGNIGGALATVGSGAFATLRQNLRGTGDDAERESGRIRGALGTAFSGIGAAATTATGAARTAMSSIPAIAEASFRSIGERAGAAVSTAGGHFARFTGMISGVGRAGASLAMSGIGGLYQAIGGGAGVAIGIAGAAFSILLSNYQRAEKNAQSARQAAVQYADELRRSNGIITENITKQTDQALATDGVTQATSKLGISAGELREAVINGGPALDDIKDRLYTARVTTDDFGEAFNLLMYGIGLSDDPTAAAVDNLDKVAASIKGGRDLANQLPKALDDARDAISRQGQAAQSTVTNNQAWTTAIQNLGDESKTSDDKVSGLSNALLGMSDPQAKARDAARDTAAAFRDLPAQIDAAKGAIDRHNGSIDVTTKEGSDLSQTLDTLRQAYGDTYGAEFQKAISSGHDFKESSDIAARAAGGIRDKLYEVGNQAGLSKDQVDGIVREFGLVPKDVPIDMHVNGALQTQTDIQNVIDKINAVKLDVPVNVRISGDAQRALFNLGLQIDYLPDGSVNVTAHDEAARTTMNALMAFGRTLQTDPSIAANPQRFDEILLQKINEARVAVGLPTLSARDQEFQGILANALQLANSKSGIPGLGLDPNGPPGSNRFNPLFADRLKAIQDANPTLFVKGNFDDVNRQLRDLATQVITLPVAPAPVVGGQPIPIFNQPTVRHATGGIDVIQAMASGGMRGMAAGIANVVAPNTPTLIGDRKKDDEAYIPINDSPRSIAILTATAQAMGFKLMPMAIGGLTGAVTAPVVGMAAGGTTAEAAAGATVDPKQQQQAAVATDSLNAALQNQADTLATLNPALATNSTATATQQTATAALATANNAQLVPALQFLVNNGLNPVVAQLVTSMFPALANYQFQTGTNSVLANQALQVAQGQTASQSQQLAAVTMADQTNMANYTGASSAYQQNAMLLLRNGMITTSNQSGALKGAMINDHNQTMVSAFNSTNYQVALQDNLKRGMGTVVDATVALADITDAQYNRAAGAAGNHIRWMYQFPLTSLTNAFNKLNGDFALGKPAAILPPVGFATGGTVPGAGNRDTVPAMLTPGEFVVSKPAVAAAGGIDALANWHHMMRSSGRQSANQEFLNKGGPVGGGIQHFSAGGPVEMLWPQMWDFIRGAFPTATLNSSYRAGTTDWHGRGKAIDLGGPMDAINRYIAQRWPNSTELIHTPGINLYHGAPHTYNAATQAEHRNHVHWAMADRVMFDGRTPTPDWAGGGGSGAPAVDVQKTVDDAFAKTYQELGDMPKFFPGVTPTIEAGVGTAAADGMKKLAFDSISASVAMAGNGPLGSGPVMAQLAQAMAPYGWNVGPEWDALLWIIGHESSFNPTISSPISTAHGLFQFLDSTWGAYGGTKTDNPLQQSILGARYIKQRYGDPINAQKFWASHGWYDDGGIASGPGLMAKLTTEPERVLSPQQTRSFDTLVSMIGEKDLLKAIQPAADQGPNRVYNVYPRETQSEESIAQAVRRRDSFDSRLR